METRSTRDASSDADDELFCAVMNPATGNYIDLSHLSTTPNKVGKGEHHRKGAEDWEKTRWVVRSKETGLNFTLGVCSSPASEDDEVAGTTGAYYVDPVSSRQVSIGKFATQPRFMGKKLTLEYEGGDVCPNGVDGKAALLNFVCDKEIATKAQVQFVGSLHNCSYYFEVRSIYACPTSHKSNDVNVLGIFFGIFLVFFAVEWGRRWFYRKMRSRMRYTGNAGPASAGAADRVLRPHWENVEGTSWWRRVLKRLARRRARPRTAAIKLSSSPQYHSPSTDSLVRDMEAQNRLLDNLEAVGADADTATVLD
ncbi:LAQU0S04e05644g1_1 [Lachancea quebecensis]|uniref:LAQU0S04e05644g1_1 n=1 Tax=Lachancea quebecensis TaxID=1654605 RepID=A0A0N7MLD6_9SACH|nr:LAQU0S04e05644g1_1 [Lachancea quebecensis]